MKAANNKITAGRRSHGAYLAFTGKELTESARSYKLLILGAVFLFFGMSNPVVAKLTPEILAQFMPEGVTVNLADPTAADSWVQFFKNMQMQLLLFVILYGGLISAEIYRGTLINMLTKGLKRKTVILSKLSATALIWTVAYAGCFLITLCYTLYLLPGTVDNLAVSALGMWLYGLFVISLSVLGGVIFANTYGSLLTAGGFVLLLMIPTIIPDSEALNPTTLVASNMALITGAVSVEDFLISAGVTILLTAAAVVSSLIIFARRQL